MSIIREPFNSQIISIDVNLRKVIKIFHNTKADLLFVCDDNKRLLGVVSQGDINKFLSDNEINSNLDANVRYFFNPNYKSLSEGFE